MEAKTGGRERDEPGSASPGVASGHHSAPKVHLRVSDASQAERSARPDDLYRGMIDGGWIRPPLPVCPNCGLAALPQLQFVIVQQRHWKSW